MTALLNLSYKLIDCNFKSPVALSNFCLRKIEMERFSKGQHLKGVSKDKGDFGPGFKYGGKAEDFPKFKLQVEHHARGVRILHDQQIKEGEEGYNAANGRTADDQVWIRVEDSTAYDLLS